MEIGGTLLFKMKKKRMKGGATMINLMKNMAIGAGAAVALVTALPIAGAIGTVTATATGAAVASVVGASAVAIEYFSK